MEFFVIDLLMLSNRYPKRGDIYRVNFAFRARIVMLWSPLTSASVIAARGRKIR